jgi:hypothetical protein
LKNRLNASNIDLEVALQANRNFSSELNKSKHTNEQITEQLEGALKEKRRLTGNFLKLLLITRIIFN